MAQSIEWPAGDYGEEIPKPGFLETDGHVDLDEFLKFTGAINDWIFASLWLLSPVQHETADRKAWVMNSFSEIRKDKREEAEEALKRILSADRRVGIEAQQLLRDWSHWEGGFFSAMSAIEPGSSLAGEPFSTFWDGAGKYNAIISGYLRAYEHFAASREGKGDGASS